MLQEQDGEMPKRQSASSNVMQPSDAAAAARTVRSGPPRGGGRGRPVSDGQSYRNSGGGSGRLRPEEPRSMRSPYSARNRQRLSSSEQLPVEV